MISDSRLKQRVLDEISWDPRVAETHIGVTTSDGSVTLAGHVNSYHEKYGAISAAKRVHGVKAIADEITVEIDSDDNYDDGTIAKHIAHVLQCNVSIPDSDVLAKVQDGFVTLTGEVDWHHQRAHIERQVGHVGGVSGLSNAITLKPRVTPSDVRIQIEEALSRNASQEAQNVKVSVNGSTVTLDGSVKALYERDLVENAVWKAPGVRFVVDRIHVN